MEQEETQKLEAYLKSKLNASLRLVPKKDSAEVYLGAEFLAVVYKDVDEGETCYQFQMAVLEEDMTG